MRGMDEDHLMTLCALSGCDYLPSVYGMGLKKAHRLVSRHKEVGGGHANTPKRTSFMYSQVPLGFAPPLSLCRDCPGVM